MKSPLKATGSNALSLGTNTSLYCSTYECGKLL